MKTLIAATLLIFGFANSTAAQDWDQWRGPARDGIVPASNAPSSWPASLSRAWRAEIGEGYSSPVVSRGSVFVHGRKDPEEVVIAINVATGKTIGNRSTRPTSRKTNTPSTWPRGQTRRRSSWATGCLHSG